MSPNHVSPNYGPDRVPSRHFFVGSTMAKALREKAVETASYRAERPLNRPLKDRPIRHPSPVNRAERGLPSTPLFLVLALREVLPTFMSHTRCSAIEHRSRRQAESSSELGARTNTSVRHYSTNTSVRRYLLRTSSRFMIWLATMVRAADSASGRPLSGSDSPVSRSFTASSGFDA